MILALLAAATAQLADPNMPPPGAPAEAPGPNGPGPRRMFRQVFIAPSGEPFRAAPDAPYPVADWFARANSSHDGKLTEAQFTADFLRFTASLDLNHDGVIDAAEVQNYETAIAPEVRGQRLGGGEGTPGGQGREGWGGDEGGWGGGHGHGDGNTDGNPGGGGDRPHDPPRDRPQGAARFSLLSIAEPVAAMDTAGGGKVAMQAAQAAAAARFALLDSRHRGFLTLADLPETPMQARRRAMREQMRGRDNAPRPMRDGTPMDMPGGGMADPTQ